MRTFCIWFLETLIIRKTIHSKPKNTRKTTWSFFIYLFIFYFFFFYFDTFTRRLLGTESSYWKQLSNCFDRKSQSAPSWHCVAKVSKKLTMQCPNRAAIVETSFLPIIPEGEKATENHYGNFIVGNLNKFLFYNCFISLLLIVEKKINIKYLKINVKWTSSR